MKTDYILSLIAVILIIAAMGFLSATPIMKKYYAQKLQAENQYAQIKNQLNLKITNLKNKLKRKKKK